MTQQTPAFSDPAATARRRRKWLWGMVGVITLILLVVARPAYREMKAWRARGFAAEVRQLAQSQRWPEAFAKAQSAYHLAPHEPEVIRAVARLYTTLGQARALDFWQQLLELKLATTADRKELLLLALTLDRLDLAQSQLDILTRELSEDVAVLSAAAEFYSRRNNPVEALKFSRLAVAKSPGNTRTKFLLGRLLLGSPLETDRRSGQDLLREVARGQDATALDALILLRDTPGLSIPDSTFVVTRLLSHPLAQLDHHLWAYEAKLRMEPEQREALVQLVLNRYAEAQRDGRLTLARWLNRLGEFRRTLAVLPLATAKSDREMLLVHLDALAALGRWAEIKPIIELADSPIENWLRELFQARLAQEAGRAVDADVHWRRVHVGIPDQPRAVLYAAQYAERARRTDDAIRFYRRLADNPATARDAYAALVRLAEPSTSTRSVRELVRAVLKSKPDDLAAQNDLAYLDLLLRENLEAAAETGRRLHTEHPNFLAYRTTLALAHLRQTNALEAVKLVDLDVDWRLVLPGWQAVRAAALGASGQTNEARTAVRRIPLDRLRDEERALLKGWL